LEDLLPESGFAAGDQENSRKIPENYILPKDSGSQKEESRGSRG
jgi:hypothetical protein